MKVLIVISTILSIALCEQRLGEYQNYLRLVLPQISEDELPPVYIRHVPKPTKDVHVPIIPVSPPTGVFKRQVKNVQGTNSQSQRVVDANELQPSVQLRGRTLFYNRSPSHIEIKIQEVPLTIGDNIPAPKALQHNWFESTQQFEPAPRFVEQVQPQIVHHEVAQEHVQPQIVHHQPAQQHVQPEIVHHQPAQQHVQPHIVHHQLAQQHVQPHIEHHQPAQQHVQPHIVHPQPAQQHVQPHIEHHQPAQQHVQPQIVHHQPAQQHVQPHIVYHRLAQQRVQPQIVHLQPTEEHVQPQIVHHQPAQQHVQPHIVHYKPTQQHVQQVSQFVQQRRPITQDIELVNGFTLEVAKATTEHLSEVAAIEAVLPNIE